VPNVPEAHEATITQPEAEVRSGPSADPKYYATGKLHQGDKVQVLREEDGGWLAIKPPQGSFSWINTIFIELLPDKRGARVLGDDVEVRIGSSLVNAPPTVMSRSKLKRGGLVIVLDTNKMHADNALWLPILPIPDEVRYISAEAVKANPVVQRVQSSPAAMPAGPPGSAPVSAEDTAMWEQAQQAENAGKKADAADLYLLLANRTSNHELQMRCYNRIHFLRESMGKTLPYNYQAGHPTEAHYPSQAPIAPIPNYVAGQPQFAPQTTSQSTYGSYSRPPAAPVNSLQESGPGYLRRAPFWIDQKRTYVLESSNGAARMYVTEQPGVNLDQYLGRVVDLWGTIMYRGDVKTYHIQASQVRLMQ
jgi:hypothetical protein